MSSARMTLGLRRHARIRGSTKRRDPDRTAVRPLQVLRSRAVAARYFRQLNHIRNLPADFVDEPTGTPDAEPAPGTAVQTGTAAGPCMVWRELRTSTFAAFRTMIRVTAA